MWNLSGIRFGRLLNDRRMVRSFHEPERGRTLALRSLRIRKKWRLRLSGVKGNSVWPLDQRSSIQPRSALLRLLGLLEQVFGIEAIENFEEIQLNLTSLLIQFLSNCITLR